MTNVLVAYASKHGSTAEIAHAIEERLRESGLGVECVEAGDVRRLEPYDAVVLGSAVYVKRWRGDARRFLRKHGEALSQRPFWVFSSGPIGEPTGDEAASGWLEPAKVVEGVERLGARGHVVFGGRVPTGTHWPIHRTMEKNTPPEFRDRRDWDEIRAWADGIAAELREPASRLARRATRTSRRAWG
jgi:menaquinone-dependent protoporphyrinogen oxidase